MNNQGFQHFSAEERQKILQEIHELLVGDSRLSTAILVGSGARGFDDLCSDIDLTVAVTKENDLQPAFNDFISAFKQGQDVLSSFSGQPEPEVYLFGAYLACLIEVDISFMHVNRMYAREKDWRILFDRSQQMAGRMADSWSNREPPDLKNKLDWHLGEIWYFIIHAANSLARDHLWEASYHIAEVRHRAFQVLGLRLALPMGYLKSADRCPPRFLKEMESTFFDDLEKPGLFDALAAATRLFFDQADSLAAAIEAPLPVRLRKALLSHIDQRRQFDTG